jgi:hypothetical protein
MNTHRIPVIGKEGYAGKAVITQATLDSAKGGAVLSYPDERGIGVAMQYQQMEVSYKTGSVTLAFLAPVSLLPHEIDRAVDKALRYSFFGVMGALIQ